LYEEFQQYAKFTDWKLMKISSDYFLTIFHTLSTIKFPYYENKASWRAEFADRFCECYRKYLYELFEWEILTSYEYWEWERRAKSWCEQPEQVGVELAIMRTSRRTLLGLDSTPDECAQARVPEQSGKTLVDRSRDSAPPAAKSSATGATEGKKAPETQDPRPAVKFEELSKKPLIRGKEQARLSRARYDVVKALLDAWPESLNKDELPVKSVHSDAVNILKNLRKLNADWKSAIELAGTKGAGYRIANA
jgi:hypothetical protein